jgi:type III pantothenate kinase
MVSEHASPLATLGGVDAGGQNVHVAALATAMGARGVEVVVHTRRDDADLARRVPLAPGVEVDHVDAGPACELPKDELLPFMDAFADQLAEQWARERPDVVHSHFWMSAYAALRAAERVGVPVVHTFHALGVVKRRYQGEKDTSPPGRLQIERDVVARADHVVATCTDEVFELIRLGAENAQLTVIPCGVDLSLFGPAGPAEPRRRGMKRLLTVGRLVQRKGVGNVISALPAVPDAELVVAGGPHRARLDRDPEARRLLELAEQAGVADRLDLRGRVERANLPALLRSADAVVCAPWYEPFGIVPLEAMACGVPVVASAVGGLIDTVVDGQTGVHVPPRDPDRLGEALADLLADPERRRAYGAAGVERARRLYRWERIATATLDVYARVARERRPRLRSARRFELAPSGTEHVAALTHGLVQLGREAERLGGWGERIARVLLRGGRLLTAGDGTSATNAEHLATELMRRERPGQRPLGALCLNGDRWSFAGLTDAHGHDATLGYELQAHARPGDALVVLGSGAALLRAVEAARALDVETFALTSDGPESVARAAGEAVCLSAPSLGTLEELQLVAMHMLCGALERELALSPAAEELAGARR